MKVVLPMAGFGTRLRPHTWSKPKPLVPVAGKPVLGHVLDMFGTLPRIDEVVFIIGYLGEQIETYVSKAYPDLKASYVVQEEMLGQSHALWLAREHMTDPMLMAFVDTIIEVDLSGLSQETDALAWVKAVPDPRPFGVAEVDQKGRVLKLIEKQDDMSKNLALVGFYHFPEAESLVQAIEAQMDRDTQLGGEYYLVDAINIMLDEGLDMRVERVEVWQDCGKPEALLETNRYLLDHGRDNISDATSLEGVEIIAPVFIDPSAKVHNSKIGPHVSLGADCRVEDSVIKDSIIDTGTTIIESDLSASLLGRGARIQGRFLGLNVGDSAEVISA